RKINMILKVIFTCVLAHVLVVSCNTLSPNATSAVKLSYSENHRLSALPTNYTTMAIEDMMHYSSKALMAIDRLQSNQKSFNIAVLKGMCNSGQTMFSRILNKSLKALLEVMISDQQKSLAHIHIPELPVFVQPETNGMRQYPYTEGISEFKMNNILLEGLENVMIQKCDFDVCAMSTIFEVTVPALTIKGDYTLKGMVDNSPVTGAGNMTVAVNTLYIKIETSLDCNMVIFSEDDCRLSNRNKTMDVSLESVSVSTTGVHYKDLSKSRIDEGINSFIDAYIKSDQSGLVEKITQMLVSYKNEVMKRMSPSKLLNKLKEMLLSIIIDLKKHRRSYNGHQIIHNYISNYV
ncbi:Uncharacterized protein FWK35_00022892, partial [Aphis craccivora]